MKDTDGTNNDLFESFSNDDNNYEYKTYIEQ